MFKLIFLTLLGFVTVLVVFGEGEGRRIKPRPEPLAASAPQPAPDALSGQPLAPPPVSTPVSTPDPALAPVDQTPHRPREFPGPALRPSPEHGDRTPVAPVEGANTRYITGDSVNLRSGPSTSDAVIGRLTRGQTVTVTGTGSGEWAEIRDAAGRTGFMAAQFLSTSRP